MSQTNLSMGLGISSMNTENSDIEMENLTNQLRYYQGVHEQLAVPQSANISALAAQNLLPRNNQSIYSILESIPESVPESLPESLPESYDIVPNRPLTNAEKRAKELDDNTRTLFAFNTDEERIDYIREVLGLDEDEDDPEEIAGLTENDLVEAGAELLTDQMSGGKGNGKKKKSKKNNSKKSKKNKSKTKKNKSNKNKNKSKSKKKSKSKTEQK